MIMAGESILVIAEQDQITQKLCLSLQEFGHHAVVFEHAGSGMQWFMKHRPLLVFVHAQIAGVNELIGNMRANRVDFQIVVL